LQHTCQAYRIRDYIDFCARNVAHENGKQTSKKKLIWQISVIGFEGKYKLGHSRTVGDAVGADFEWSKGAVRPCRPI
jgi:nitrogenase molybdenum-iron protein alpha/beta subunit